MKKLFSRFCAFLCLLGLLITSSAAAFADVPSTHWAYDTIERMAQQGIMHGVGDNRFQPESPLTRAEFITVVTRAMIPEQMDAAPQQPWYAVNYKAAVQAGLVLESETPNLAAHLNGNITRYEMARLLVRVDEKVSQNPAVTADKSLIKDYANIPEQFRYFVEQAYAKRLLIGDGVGRFSGSEDMTRAQATVVIDRLFSAAETEPPYNRDEFLANYQSRWDGTPEFYQKVPRPTRMPELGEHTEQYLAASSLGSVTPYTYHYRLLDAETKKPLPYATLHIWFFDSADIFNQYFVMPVRSDRNGELTFTLNRVSYTVSYLLLHENYFSNSSLRTDVTVGGVQYNCKGPALIGLADANGEMIELLFTPKKQAT